MKKIVLFGSTGKIGTAILAIFDQQYSITALDRSSCDARDLTKVQQIVKEVNPDIVINAAAFNGVDACESDPFQALQINTIFPKLLAELSNSHGFLLVHFSSDAVFSGFDACSYSEDSSASPINIYGLTKYGGDCFVTAIAERYYIARISLQFGENNGKLQFVENMLERLLRGNRLLQISDDIIASPSYSRDVAKRVKLLIEEQSDFGLYHVANEGQASLYELICELVDIMKLEVVIENVSHTNFPSIGMKNKYIPIISHKILPLRPWREALVEYCTTNYLK